jgi:hypothetical protein
MRCHHGTWALLVIASWPEPALAQSGQAAHHAPSGPGIAIVLASIAAGAALTTYGLTVDCGLSDHACHRRASLPIWGGVGVASVGSIVGLVLLQSPNGSSTPALTLGGRFE